jgi:urate oxidase
MANEVELALHHHGKSRVRLGRVWREGNVHHFVEWMVHTMIESDMEAAFIEGDNTGMTPTDTQKNTVSHREPQIVRSWMRVIPRISLSAGVRGRQTDEQAVLC